MKLEKLLANLDDYLKKVEKGKSGHCNKVDDLLRGLERKRRKLKKKLDGERNATRQKRLNTQLKIVTL